MRSFPVVLTRWHNHLRRLLQYGHSRLQRQGLADVYGDTDVPIYCLNVAYPLIPNELVQFWRAKSRCWCSRRVSPSTSSRYPDSAAPAGRSNPCYGKDIMPMAGEYTGQVMLEGITRFLEAASRTAIPMKLPLEAVLATETPVSDEDIARLMAELPPRPAGCARVP
ncbi:MAG: hypothetical protein CM15mP125_1110 [Gammaproteobacteria bacterium]|nr:MAG: hypothetical protein CM15mP125_1110 [Gammaproteobacteria bacterium]